MLREFINANLIYSSMGDEPSYERIGPAGAPVRSRP